jgi:paraquat-inducible protein A
MIVTKLGKTQPYTIFTGLKELAHVGLWPLAVLVFIASIAIPVFKLVMLGYMLGETQRGSAARRQGRTRLYRLLDFIGRWSMVDIFVVSILASLIRFGWFAQISAGMGAIYFAGVVVLTLMAVKSFDPRLMWDAIPETRPAPISLTAAHPAPNVAA